MSRTELTKPQFRIHLLLAGLGIAGIATIVLPFTYDVAPLGAVLEGVMSFWERGEFQDPGFFGPTFRLGLPAFLSILVSAALFRWLFSASFSRTEQAIGYLASSTTSVLTLSVLLEQVRDGELRSVQGSLMITLPFLIILSGTLALVRNLKKGVSRQFSVVLALQVSYLADCLLCFIAFYPEWSIGAYFALVTSAVYLAQIILVLTLKPALAR